MSGDSVKNGHTYVQWMVAILANIAVFVYGFENSWISPMTKILQSDESPAGAPLSDYAISWIASAMGFAATFGTSAYAYMADRFGRKIAVMALLYPQAISWALKLYPTVLTLTLSRIVGGLAAGGIFNVVPMYVKEISQDSIRGTLGSLLILSQNLGVLFMFIIGTYFDYYTVQWSIIGIPIVTAILMLKAPEAPAFLVKLGKMDEAHETVAFLRGLDVHDKRVLEEVDRMKKEEDTFQSLPKVQLKTLFIDSKWRRSIIIFLISSTIHGCSGAYAIMVYALTLLTYASSDFVISPEVQSFSFPIVMICACLLLAVFVERVGRKRLLVAAYAASGISFGVLATSILARDTGLVPGWLPLVAMIVNVFAYAGGVSSLTYIILTEVFNFQVRAKVMGMIVTYIWFLESIQLLIYAPISKFFGYSTLFYLFTIINFIGMIFVLIYVPETKGKSEEEVQRIIRGDRKDVS
ncbi:facilitated trehalose transporter Tret1-like [Colias croceus]|uniref:facilitated trehalose transporter Tret1-like n=1 Tax=Colias crocea TaxID=72248 RepID=UPI001E27EBE7|nr:facilitated trehalose transporter Tret1-like [Colias croceus]